MQASHKIAEEKYKQIRRIAYEITEEELPYQDKKSISLTEITNLALVKAKVWSFSEHRRVDWDWSSGSNTYKKRYPNRFELAVWYNNVLCGLSVGRPSFHGSRVRLDFIERSPGINPLTGRVTPISTTAFEVYARLIDAKQIRIMFPKPALIEYYSSLEYTYIKGSGTDQKPNYLYKNI